MKVIYPDNETNTIETITSKLKSISIFLAGTIDNGNSEDWQQKVIDKLKEYDNKYPEYFITVFNPRCKKWNKNAGKEELEYQIRWEQEHLDKANLIIMVLSDSSKSPISLLEFGLYAQTGKLIVFCTEKFYRFDNIRLTCEKYFIPLVQSTNVDDIISNIQDVFK